MTSDRSTLEGKDRAELTVIAEAMGNKVGSRMRKAQIIDLIVGDDAKVEASVDEPPKQNKGETADSQLAFADAASDDESTDDATAKLYRA